MSGILECEGIFQVPLADGWTVRGQPGRSYDIAHDALNVGVNISVLTQEAVGSDIESALGLVVASMGADADELSIARVPAADHDRAFTRLQVDGKMWLVSFMFTGQTAVLSTSNSDPGDMAAFAAGELVVASIGPIARSRRFGRRR